MHHNGKYILATFAHVVIRALLTLCLILPMRTALVAQEHKQAAERDRLIPSHALPGASMFGVAAEWHEPLNEPVWRTPAQSDHVKADDPVLGVYFDNKAWALPWWIMKNHHVANLTLQGQPILIAFCEMCSSGSAFIPLLDGKRYTFHVAGLYNGSNLMSDYETGSLWAPFSGEALYGLLKGKTLERVPLLQCTVAEWLALHKESLMAYADTSARLGHGSKARPGKSGIPEHFKNTMRRPPDKRLPENTLVLGVQANGKTRAYPLVVLDKMGTVFNDTLGHQPIVIVHQPETILAIAFARQLEQEVLSFAQDPTGQIVDQKYHSIWSFTGEAQSGALAGKKLTYVFSGIEEWYIWAAYHPETEIFTAPESSEVK